MCRGWSECVFCVQSSLIMIRPNVGESHPWHGFGKPNNTFFFLCSALLSASHTTYPKTFGTGSRSMPSLARPRTLTPNKWRCRMDLDVQSWKGDGWGVKPLSCKIALAAMLLFQRFMMSCSACFPTSPYLSFSPFPLHPSLYLALPRSCWLKPWPESLPEL